MSLLLAAQAAPPILIDLDTHDSFKRRKKLFDKERLDREDRRNDLIAAYEILAEGRPAEAADIIAPFAEVAVLGRDPPPRSMVDWNSLLGRIDAVDRLWAAFLEMDDEDILVMM